VFTIIPFRRLGQQSNHHKPTKPNQIFCKNVTFRIITVSVVDLPTVTIGNVEYRGSVGREITLECDVVSDPPETTVYWRRIVHQIKLIHTKPTKNRGELRCSEG
jgi:hypothetical protein